MALLYQVVNGETFVAADINQLVRALANVLGVKDSAQGIPKVLKRTIRVYDIPGEFTWSKPSYLIYAFIKVQAGGGGGGGAENSAIKVNTAPGGGGGGYGEKTLQAAQLNNEEIIVVGAGGLGGFSTGSKGGTAGGISSFGTHVIATGGYFGTSWEDDSSIGAGGWDWRNVTAGGTCSGGDINIGGGWGGYGRHEVMYNMVPALFESQIMNISGMGGRAGLGMGTPHNMFIKRVGLNGRGYGCGGEGATAASTDARKNEGGDGSQGIVIVEEYAFEVPD